MSVEVEVAPPEVTVVTAAPPTAHLLTVSPNPSITVSPITGQRGPIGPPGVANIIAVPVDEWPPVNPQPNTLYLKVV